MFVIFKEPLVQFFLAGVVLYLFFTNGDQNQNQTTFRQQKKDIVIPLEQIKEYNQTLPLGESNIEKLLSYHQILLEESYFLELYKQDKKIQQILVDKMGMLLSQKKYKEPNEKDLYSFYQTHKQEYGKIAELSFYLLDVTHYPLSEAKKLTQQLNLLAITPKNLPFEKSMTLAQIKKRYGSYFAHQLQFQFSHRWSQPLLATNKIYIVYITEKTITEDEPFANVEDRVYKEYKYQQDLKMKQEALSQIRKHYKIEVR